MNINIKTTNLEHTDAINSYVEKKLDAFNKIIDMNSNQVFVYVELEKTRPDVTNADDLYRAEITIDSAGEVSFADAATHDLYAAIDLVKDELFRKMKRDRNKKRDILRRSMGKLKRMLRFSK